MASRRIIVVRHGETLWNRTGLLQGHLDSPLTDAGLAQARAVAERLRTVSFRRLYSSDLGRSLATADAIGRETGHAVRTDPRLRERNTGVLQGLTGDQMRAMHFLAWQAYRGGDPDAGIPGGESLRQCHDRVVACFAEILARHPGEDMVVVAHGGTLNALCRHVLGIPLAAPRRFRLFNGSLNVFSQEEGVLRLDAWGDVGHLRDIGTLDHTASA